VTVASVSQASVLRSVRESIFAIAPEFGFRSDFLYFRKIGHTLYGKEHENSLKTAEPIEDLSVGGSKYYTNG
jgi:hypothetical protein